MMTDANPINEPLEELKDEDEVWHLLNLIVGKWETNSQSENSFDAQLVKRSKELIKRWREKDPKV